MPDNLKVAVFAPNTLLDEMAELVASGFMKPEAAVESYVRMAKSVKTAQDEAGLIHYFDRVSAGMSNGNAERFVGARAMVSRLQEFYSLAEMSESDLKSSLAKPTGDKEDNNQPSQPQGG